MIPQDFAQKTLVLDPPKGMTEKECGKLAVFRDDTICISCWKPTWRERLSILFFGRVWVGVLFGGKQPPISVQACKNIFTEG